MDSPIRKQQKRNDYLRHKLFRKINRKRKAEKELALKAPEKELKRRLKRPKYDDGKEELPYPLRTSTDYDDNLAYQRGISRDPITGHMWSTTQEKYPNERIYLKKPNHPTYSKAVWGDMAGGYDVYRKGNRDYAAPTFSELMYTKPPFRYDDGKEEIVYETQNTEDGTIYRVKPSAFGAKELKVTLPEVVVKPDHNVRDAVDRYFNKLSRRSERAWYTNPITGESYMPKGGPLESVYPEFDLIGLGAFVPSLRKGIIKSLQGAKQNNIIKTFNKLSDEQIDKLYFDALNKNDVKTALLLRDLHFKKTSAGNKAVDAYGNPQKTYHTVGDIYDPNFTKFNPDIEGTHSAIYTTNDPFMSGSYSSKLLSEEERDYIIENIRQRELLKITDSRNLNRFDDKFREKYMKMYSNDITARRLILKDHPKLAGNVDENRLKRLYVNLQNPVVIDNGGGFWNHIDLSQLPDDVYKNIRVDLRTGYLSNNYSTRSLEDAINKVGNYDGAIINNVIDYGPNKTVWDASFRPATVYSVRDPKRLKLSDVATYDDAGNIIPLSKRDNFNIDDIRYGMIPLLGAGGTAYGLSEYKHGKNPIHINPANRGKFNALKRRTGKTTEQLTHSKNPLTRKRAIFALNAAKWRKK